MKKKRNLFLFIVCFFIGIADAKTMSVQVKQSHLRDKASYLGKILYSVNYAERVNIIEEQGDWFKVIQNNKKIGWLHTSALTKKHLYLRSGQGLSPIASEEEIALAGKGFSADSEFKFKSFHKNMDFKWINYMESIEINRREMHQFLIKGEVSPIEGLGI